MHYSCIERLMLAKRHQGTTWLTRLCSTNSNDEYDNLARSHWRVNDG